MVRIVGKPVNPSKLPILRSQLGLEATQGSLVNSNATGMVPTVVFSTLNGPHPGIYPLDSKYKFPKRVLTIKRQKVDQK